LGHHVVRLGMLDASCMERVDKHMLDCRVASMVSRLVVHKSSCSRGSGMWP